MTIKYLLLGVTALTLAACGADKAADLEAVVDVVSDVVSETTAPVEQAVEKRDLSLEAVLDMQDASTKSRYASRNPAETLNYFGIKPGMTVAEVLPGGGWYSKILLPYLGDEGQLIGIDYSVDMWGNFGGFANEEFLNKRKTWSATWTEGALDWRAGTQAKVSAFPFGSLPRDMKGTADAVLFFRSLHHLNRWDAAYWDGALSDTKALLKDGGVVGIVQHRGPETNSDVWAKGDNGYLKQSFVISKFEEAGFELVGEPSEINGNPKDAPSADEMVWRLPPTLGTSRDNPELKAKMEAIGESDRMTLLFKKK